MKFLLAFLVCLVVVANCRADDKGYWLKFVAPSVKSDLFVSLRANKEQVLISECGKHVTQPYGILEQSYKVGSAASGDKCTWHLHAPANHVINIISISFILEDEIKPPRSDDIKVSTISIYDGAEPKETNWLATYHVSPKEKVGHFVSSLSSKQDMAVEIKYHDNKDFATQKMLINYEFIDVDKMNAILRAH